MHVRMISEQYIWWLGWWPPVLAVLCDDVITAAGVGEGVSVFL